MTATPRPDDSAQLRAELAAHCAWRDLATALDQTIAQTIALADGLGDYEGTLAYHQDW